MNSTPPPIPRSAANNPKPVESSTYSVLMVILGILMLLLALFLTITFVRQIQEIISYSFSAFGGGFTIRYLLATHVGPIVAILTWIAGLGLIMRWKIGYVMALTVAIYGIGSQLLNFVLLGSGSFYLSRLGGFQAIFLIFMIFQFLVLIATVIMLLMPAGQKHFKVSEIHLIAGIGLGLFLIIDFVICMKVLTPWAFG